MSVTSGFSGIRGRCRVDRVRQGCWCVTFCAPLPDPHDRSRSTAQGCATVTSGAGSRARNPRQRARRGEWFEGCRSVTSSPPSVTPVPRRSAVQPLACTGRPSPAREGARSSPSRPSHQLAVATFGGGSRGVRASLAEYDVVSGAPDRRAPARVPDRHPMLRRTRPIGCLAQAHVTIRRLGARPAARAPVPVPPRRLGWGRTMRQRLHRQANVRTRVPGVRERHFRIRLRTPTRNQCGRLDVPGTADPSPGRAGREERETSATAGEGAWAIPRRRRGSDMYATLRRRRTRRDASLG